MGHAPKRRLASIYNLDDAQLLLVVIPSDNEITDEEPDSDSDDPTFQPDPLGLQIVDTEDDGHGDESEDSDEQTDVPSTSHAKKPPEPKCHWKKKDVTTKVSQFDLPEGNTGVIYTQQTFIIWTITRCTITRCTITK